MTDEPHEHPATKSARQRRDAADRAKRWRDQHRERAEIDAVIVTALMRATGGRRDEAGRVKTRSAEAVLTDIVGHAAYALGGRSGFDAAKARVLARLGEAVDGYA